MGFLLDASHYQGAINWPQVKADGCLGAYIKVSDGASGVDATWPDNHAGARAVGLPAGPYHFAEGGNTATEAGHFASSWSAGWDLDPVLDYEIAGANAGWLTGFRANYRAYTGFQPFRVYSGLSLLQGALNPAGWIDAGTTIWAARYAASLSWNHPALVLWQNTSAANLEGVVGDVDEDQFMNGWTPGADMTTPQSVWQTALNTNWPGDAGEPAQATPWEFLEKAQEWGRYNNAALLDPKVGLAAIAAQLTAIQGAISAEQAALLAAIQAVPAGGVPTDAQMAALTAALEAALPSYTVSITPKTS